jgi:prepilin-type N-terminal cleavage/methylation domain-containing protein
MRRTARGFTLIEMMVTMATVGVLSSIAIPSFRNLQHRSRQSERTITMTAIKRGIDDYYTREGRFPQDLGGGWSQLTLNDNPDLAPGTERRPFLVGGFGGPLDNWKNLTIAIEGGVYYSYSGDGLAGPLTRTYTLRVYGDLDGDGVQDELRKTWTYNGADLVPSVDGCTDCTEQARSPLPVDTTF